MKSNTCASETSAAEQGLRTTPWRDEARSLSFEEASQRVFGRQKWHFPAVDRNTQCFQFIAIKNRAQSLIYILKLRRRNNVALIIDQQSTLKAFEGPHGAESGAHLVSRAFSDEDFQTFLQAG